MLFILSDYYNFETNVIKLTHTLWDDWFKYETEYIVDYIDSDKKTIRIGTIKIAHKDMGRIPNIPTRFDSLSEDFYSLGTDSMYYENLSKVFQLDYDRISILNSLRDVAFDEKLLEQVKYEDPFLTSLSRSVSIHQINGKFRRLAKGDSVKTSFKFSYIYNVGSSDDKVSFLVNEKNTLLPSNIHAIIGRNGVGKSTLIKNFIRDLSNNKTDLIDIEENGEAISYNISEFFRKIIYINFSIFDSTDGLALENMSDEMPLTLINSKTSLDTIYERASEKVNEERFSELINKLSFENELGVRINIYDVEDKWVGVFIVGLITCFERKPYLWVSILEILNSDPIFREYECKKLYIAYRELEPNDYLRQFYNFFTKLSSGHKIVMLSLTKIIELIDEEVLIIIDEPELYLHPPLLSSYIRSLSNLLEKRNGVALLATHSPVILQELPNNCIYKLDRMGKNLLASRLSTETFAQNISTLMAEVFGLEAEQSGFTNIIDDYVQSNSTGSIDQAILNFKNQLGTLGLKLLVTKLYNERNSH